KLPANHPIFQRRPDVRGAKLSHHPSAAAVELHCLCSSSEDALGFHGDVFGRMFRDVPELGGVILIIGGESYYHCFMRASDSAIGKTNCPRCNGKVPEEVIANFLKVTAEAIASVKPPFGSDFGELSRAEPQGRRQAEVFAWPYSAQYFWSDEPNQLELIDRLAEHVALLTEIDKDQTVLRGACRKRIWDYSVDYDDHSDRSVAQA